MANTRIGDAAQPSTSSERVSCPICNGWFDRSAIEEHAEECLSRSDSPSDSPILVSESVSSTRRVTLTPQPSGRQESKRNFSIFERSPAGSGGGNKRSRNDARPNVTSSVQLQKEIITNIDSDDDEVEMNDTKKRAKTSETQNVTKVPPTSSADSNVPLAERVRPTEIEDYVGQEQIIGRNTILRTLFDDGTIPSMILWGPPGCGKTTLANIIANRCRQNVNAMRFVKLSATMAGVAAVKDAIQTAKNEAKFKRRTILFMDEIHRFNKLQQDIFLPHVESGAITLIGATTENPSFSLNSALLSRCRVIVLEKHSTDGMRRILERALPEYEAVMIPDSNNNNTGDLPDFSKLPFIPRLIIRDDTVRWLAETCDGDARIGLNSLQLALCAASASSSADNGAGPKIITLEDVREGIKKSHLLYDRNGDQHYDLISALHKSIRASDDNAALYWASRMIMSGEDPRYICRRMIRMASEDIGVADTNALQVATATLTAVQAVGMPEADCIIAHCAVYLARAPKSREVYEAFKRCRASIEQWKGPMPSVPLHLRNAPTKLMQDLHYGAGYNKLHKDVSGLTYMPDELEDENYFSE